MFDTVSDIELDRIVEELRHKTYVAVHNTGMRPNQIVGLCVSVSASVWRPVLEMLLPHVDWDERYAVDPNGYMVGVCRAEVRLALLYHYGGILSENVTQSLTQDPPADHVKMILLFDNQVGVSDSVPQMMDGQPSAEPFQAGPGSSVLQ